MPPEQEARGSDGADRGRAARATAVDVWLIGCGNMGGAMLRRWAESGAFDARFHVIDPGSVSIWPGVGHSVDFERVPPNPALVLLAVKPQQLDAVAPRLSEALAGHPVILVSILAGVEEAVLQARFPAATIVRAMPNLPVAIGRGVVALHALRAERARAMVDALMAPLGLVEWIADEAMFDAVTALSGCGPGFVFRFVEALAEAGAALGLPPDQADRLARATVAGAAVMANGSDEPPAKLADRVASPGGSTRAGLNILDEDGALKQLLAATLAAAARRNAEMAAAAR